jgi:hypothetical protein
MYAVLIIVETKDPIAVPPYYAKDGSLDIVELMIKGNVDRSQACIVHSLRNSRRAYRLYRATFSLEHTSKA